MTAILLIILGGLAYRVRGGLADDILGMELPNGWIRAVWALFVTCLIPAPIYWFPVIFGLAFLGCAVGYFNAEFDIKNHRHWRNYARLTARGMFTILPVAILGWLIGYNAWWGVLAGALFVPCYEAGIAIYCISKLQTYTQYGEFLLGAAITAGLLCMS